MLQITRFDELGRFSNDWLNARYHFSFSDYHNPERMGVGLLRVINDDTVAPGGGFGMHPHRDMEIITYVRSGAITHRDNLCNEGRTAAGDVQVMSAGSGIVHAEHNEEDEPTNLYQIWIHTAEKGVTPRWEQRTFPKEPVSDALPLLVSGRPQDTDSDALFIHQDATIHGGRLAEGTRVTQPLGESAYLLVSEGSAEINGKTLHKGDGLAAIDEDSLTIRALEEAELLVINVPLQQRAA